MIELRPCPACKRHVDVREVACPFCEVALAPQAAQRVVLRGRVSRAAVFGAALAASAAGCSKHDEPVPIRSGSGSGSDMQELERMLDDPYAGRTAVSPPADASPDALAVVAIDAGVPPDAGRDADAVARREAERRRKEAERREAERRRAADERRRADEAERQRIEIERQQDYRHMAKPYGAPPARRRIV